MRVRHGYPEIRIVSRMWDRRFAEQLETFLKVHSVMSSADLAAPAFAGAAVGVEITQTLEIEGVEYSTMHLTVVDGSFLVGSTVGSIHQEHELDIVLVDRDGDAKVRPSREIEVRVRDGIVIFARQDRVLEVLSLNMGRKLNPERKARSERKSRLERRSGSDRKSRDRAFS